MITRCPSCQTHFRVHAKQLAARAGQVRCGRCNRVFNAIEHLFEETLPAQESSPVDENAEHQVDASVPGPGEHSVTEQIEVSADQDEAGAGAEAAAKRPGPKELAAAGVEDEPPQSAAPLGAPPVILPDVGAFEFGPQADPGGRARRPPWLLGTLLMLATLLGQMAYYYRGTAVLLFPETKLYASALCAKLGCEVPLPRRVDLMSIEASDLQADPNNANLMVLTATIKNRAIFNQQHPFLELTLTDGQDQPLVRRVLTPKDYIGKALNAQAGVAPNSEFAIKVIIEGSQIKATGYRLYLFYP